MEVEYKPEDVKKELPQFNGKHHDCPNSNYGKTPTNTTPITPTQIPAQTDLDRRVLDKMESETYHQTFLLIAKYRGVKKACNECGINEAPIIGIIFNNACDDDRITVV